MSAWEPEKALELARSAYQYVARVLPPDAALEAIGEADRAVLDAEERPRPRRIRGGPQSPV